MNSGKGQPHQPDDRGYLISRSLDDDLSPEERRRLEALLSDDAAARQEHEEYSRLTRLLDDWGKSQPDIDFPRLERRVVTEIRRGRNTRRSAWQLVIRLGSPLAAAAAIALVLWLPARYAPSVAPGVRPFVVAELERPSAPRLESAGAGAAIPGVQVAFARTTWESTGIKPQARRIMVGPVTRMEELTEVEQFEALGTH